MDPGRDPLPGSSSAKKSESEDDVPLARQRKDLKGKVKKSGKKEEQKGSQVSNVDSVVTEENKVPKGKNVASVVTEKKKDPKGKDVGSVEDHEKKVPKGENVGSIDNQVKKVPKGKAPTSVNVASSSANVVNDDQDEEEGGDLELTEAESTQGWSLTRRRRVLKVLFL